MYGREKLTLRVSIFLLLDTVIRRPTLTPSLTTHHSTYQRTSCLGNIDPAQVGIARLISLPMEENEEKLRRWAGLDIIFPAPCSTLHEGGWVASPGPGPCLLPTQPLRTYPGDTNFEMGPNQRSKGFDDRHRRLQQNLEQSRDPAVGVG